MRHIHGPLSDDMGLPIHNKPWKVLYFPIKLKMKLILLGPLKELNLSTLIHFMPNHIRSAAKGSEWKVSDMITTLWANLVGPMKVKLAYP